MNSKIESAALSAREFCQVTERRVIAPGLVVLRFRNRTVATQAIAGQFVNVLPRSNAIDPLLRRPFSIYGTDGQDAEIIVQAIGKGTELLANTMPGEILDVLGPLGRPWQFDSPSYKTAILIIGGVGVASMPLLTRALLGRDRAVATYYGARTGSLFAKEGLVNVHESTDDGSAGYHGTNVALLAAHLREKRYESPKLFVCGPTGMMRAASNLANEHNIPCEISLETEMACGIGICQGCPVLTDEETFTDSGKRFRLVCTEGPSFMTNTIAL